jgi:hypothetical protein
MDSNQNRKNDSSFFGKPRLYGFQLPIYPITNFTYPMPDFPGQGSLTAKTAGSGWKKDSLIRPVDHNLSQSAIESLHYLIDIGDAFGVAGDAA